MSQFFASSFLPRVRFEVMRLRRETDDEIGTIFARQRSENVARRDQLQREWPLAVSPFFASPMVAGL